MDTFLGSLVQLWTILKEIGIPDLSCLLRNLYAGQEATVRTRHETTDCFQIGQQVQEGQKSVKMKHSFLNRAVSFFFFLIWLHQLFVAAHGLL